MHVPDNTGSHEEITSEATSAAEEVIASPREIATEISKWILAKGVSQKFFAAKILNRSQGSLSDYISKAPSEMPKTHGRTIWMT